MIKQEISHTSNFAANNGYMVILGGGSCFNAQEILWYAGHNNSDSLKEKVFGGEGGVKIT